MHGARPVVAGPGADIAGLLGDRGAAGRLAKGGVPGAGLAEQRRHVVIAAAIEPEAIFGEHLADRVLLLERGRHRRTPCKCGSIDSARLLRRYAPRNDIACCHCERSEAIWIRWRSRQWQPNLSRPATPSGRRSTTGSPRPIWRRYGKTCTAW